MDSVLRLLARRRVPIGFVTGRRRPLAGASDPIVARDRRDARCVRRSAAHLGGRASREEPRGHDVGSVPIRETSALCRARASWAPASPSPPTASSIAVLVLGYLAVTLTAAIRTEEAHLTEKFGNDYPDYRNGRVSDARRFSLARAHEEPGVSRPRGISRRPRHSRVEGVTLNWGLTPIGTQVVD